jgi:hypothetical protein
MAASGAEVVVGAFESTFAVVSRPAIAVLAPQAAATAATAAAAAAATAATAAVLVAAAAVPGVVVPPARAACVYEWQVAGARQLCFRQLMFLLVHFDYRHFIWQA